ncbi:MAG: TIGR00730 family Rossman fold protein [Woeseiaceae bacterium]
MKRICVYCGSNAGRRSGYAAAARELATLLAQNRIGLVYGGAAKGLMGVLADAVLEAGGEAIGVIPRQLMEKEIGHAGLTELHVVDSMHERKTKMALLSNGFVALPGGYGTLEEIIEVLTWGQLKFHAKPCGLLNVDGFFDPLLSYLDRARTEGFLTRQHREMLLLADTPAALLRQFERYQAPVDD